jgi:putative two-component system response regulator
MLTSNPARRPEVSEPLFGSENRLDLLLLAAHILVIDDEEVNLRLISNILARAGYGSVSTLGDARLLEQTLELVVPDLVISDLHMPHRDGFDVIRALQPWIVGERLPVLVVSGDQALDSRNRALALGARDFVTKPFDPTEMTLRVRTQLETRVLYQDVQKQNRALRDAMHGQTIELEEARVELLERLAVAAEYHDQSTARHTERVGIVSARIAGALGMPADAVQHIRRAAPLHDIGKIGIPDALLLKRGALTEPEAQIMRTHTIIGAHILGGSPGPVLRMAEVIALSHHEWWDGQGYPLQLSGEAIPLPGRIVAVADAFDAIVSDRPYRSGRPVRAAIHEIARYSGTQFDPAVAGALARLAPHLSDVAPD